MARRKLEPGELGKIKTVRVSPRRYRARVRVGVVDGPPVRVQADASTAHEAEVAVADAARRRAGVAEENPAESPTLGALVAETLARYRVGDGSGHTVRPQTYDRYRRTLPYMLGTKGHPAIATRSISDIRPGEITRWLEDFSRTDPAVARHAKVVLTRTLAEAMRYDIVDWSFNPAANAKLETTDKAPAKALTEAELRLAHAAAARWQTPSKSVDLVGIIDTLAGTGLRPGEVLALRWSDVDLLSSPARLTVTGTIVTRTKTNSTDRCVQRQDIPKTDSGWRVVVLPTFVEDLLLERFQNARSEFVFPNRNGGPLGLDSVNRRWREARGDELAHVQLRSFRTTVATHLARTVGPEEAARQLGHGDPRTTLQFYIERAHEAGDYREVLDALDPS